MQITIVNFTILHLYNKYSKCHQYNCYSLKKPAYTITFQLE